jgi:hypothetical protein
MSKLGFTPKRTKLEGPTTCIKFLGVIINTIRLSISLPEEKLQKLRIKMDSVLQTKEISLKDLQSLVGSLIWAGRVEPLVRPFIRPFIDQIKVYNHQERQGKTLDIKIPQELILILEWWKAYLPKWKGRRLFLSHKPVFVPTIASDAATSAGIGAVFGNETLQEEVPAWLRGHDINELELYGVVRGFKKWAPKLKGKFVVLLTDNTAAMWACQNMSSPTPHMNKLLMELATTAAEMDISFSVRHIAGVNNVLADALSRGKKVNTDMVNKHISEMVKEINLADVFDTF